MSYDRAKDPLSSIYASGTSGCRQAAAITPSDTVDLDFYVKAIRVDGAGALRLLPVGNADGDVINITVAAGEVVDWLQVRRVLAAGTSATGIVGGWG